MILETTSCRLLQDIGFLSFRELILYSLQLLTAMVKPLTLSLPVRATSSFSNLNFSFPNHHPLSFWCLLSCNPIQPSQEKFQFIDSNAIPLLLISLITTCPYSSCLKHCNYPFDNILNSISIAIYFHIFKPLFYTSPQLHLPLLALYLTS